MSSSSSPEPGSATPHIDVAQIEEAERALEQRPVRAETALGVKTIGRAGGGRGALVTFAYAAPGTGWLGFFLIAPVVFIILVSFWQRTISGFDAGVWTLHNYSTLFDSPTYWNNLWQTFWHALAVTGGCLVLGFPVAYFLTMSVKSLRNQIALFVVALAPFWTSAIIRAEAWVPVSGREGAINAILNQLGIGTQDWLLYSDFAVVIAMIQNYILFVITPLFFMLAQIDRTSLESARDLGANWWKSFREVILPQSMPGVVIGSIFAFVLSMGDYGTVLFTGGGRVNQIANLVQSNVTTVLFPQAAAAAAVLVLATLIGVIVLLRFANLREEL